MTPRSQLQTTAAALALAALAGCGYSPTVGEYSVGGVVSGLSTEGVLLSDAAGSAVYVSADGRFSIENAFPNGAAYDITVSSDAPTKRTRCSIEKGTGVISGTDVQNVSVICEPATYTIGGTVKGLEAIGLILTNGVQNVTLATDGSFTFTTALLDGSSYEVSISQQPETGKCTISNEKGTIDGDDVTSVTVSCSDDESDEASAELTANATSQP